ncbi:MAG: hypothetical protein E3K40_02760 [Candidatus Brocadia sp.]|nr:hypothetical protein [Candidatus Brocadia sp.]MDG6025632.1 hypothetical protein [Candidatus Brocadia sp.]
MPWVFAFCENKRTALHRAALLQDRGDGEDRCRGGFVVGIIRFTWGKTDVDGTVTLPDTLTKITKGKKAQF